MTSCEANEWRASCHRMRRSPARRHAPQTRAVRRPSSPVVPAGDGGLVAAERQHDMLPDVAPVDRPIDPRSAPAYTVAEAAALVRVPVSTLKAWIHGEGASKKGLLVLPPSRPRLLAFSHLV